MDHVISLCQTGEPGHIQHKNSAFLTVSSPELAFQFSSHVFVIRGIIIVQSGISRLHNNSPPPFLKYSVQIVGSVPGIGVRAAFSCAGLNRLGFTSPWSAWLIWAKFSSVMYGRQASHSSFYSNRMTPTRRVMVAPLGKIPTALASGLTSLLCRSKGLVEWVLARSHLSGFRDVLAPDHRRRKADERAIDATAGDPGCSPPLSAASRPSANDDADRFSPPRDAQPQNHPYDQA